jgi:hypothetical protein
MAMDTTTAHRGTAYGHRLSGRQTARKQPTVNPPIAPARYNFLYSSSRPACGRPPTAAVLGRCSLTRRTDERHEHWPS